MNKQIHSFVAEGQKVLREEAAAVTQVADLLGASFDAAVKLILELSPSGRVVVTGLGKAGIIAQKVSATLASTGTSSFSIHPTDALHGDLGRTHKTDLALILSNSGETAEIIQLLPQLRAVGVPIIAITGAEQSTLAKHADVVLSIGLMNEAGELGLAPTSSTTAMVALGDALALVILKARGFTAEQFAANHPAGSLGRALMKVGDVMRSGAAQCVVLETELVSGVLKKISLTPGRPGAAAVVDASGKLVGVFTDGNLRRCLEQGSAFLGAPISTVMGKNPKCISPQQFAKEALLLLIELHVDQLIIVDEQHAPIGLVDIQDVAGF